MTILTMAVLTTAQATKSQAGIVPARLDRVISVDLAPKSPRERWFMFTYNCSVVAQPTAAAPGARLLTMAAAFAYAMARPQSTKYPNSFGRGEKNS